MKNFNVEHCINNKFRVNMPHSRAYVTNPNSIKANTVIRPQTYVKEDVKSYLNPQLQDSIRE